MTLKIGNVSLSNPFLLAPLAGITDASMRCICRKKGASLVYSEMVSGKGLMYNDKNTERLLEIYEEEKPVAVQIFGGEPDVMEAAADKLKDLENAILDINMGCPVPKVVKNGEGSALLKDPDLAGIITEKVVKAAGKPVTVKIRAGWNDKNINAVEMARVLEQAGAAAVAVHGRTREQYYEGKANWDVIGEVKESVKIPVIGNGDVFCAEDALRIMDYTGCDFVMIARGALGNPWIFRDAKALWEGKEIPAAPALEEKVAMMKTHFNALLKLKGEYCAVREMRKHTGWYLKGMRGAAAIRKHVNTISDAGNLLEEYDRILSRG